MVVFSDSLRMKKLINSRKPTDSDSAALASHAPLYAGHVRLLSGGGGTTTERNGFLSRVSGDLYVAATTAQTVDPRPEATPGRGSKYPREEAISLRRSAPPPRE